mmetsp:Transcript_37758/g.116671  ORF Transcript_37758/g.116671 Transcript_37758/m.116671 type:complete len:306 (-) Transcript_37758:557-1474(-)
MAAGRHAHVVPPGAAADRRARGAEEAAVVRHVRLLPRLRRRRVHVVPVVAFNRRVELQALLLQLELLELLRRHARVVRRRLHGPGGRPPETGRPPHCRVAARPRAGVGAARGRGAERRLVVVLHTVAVVMPLMVVVSHSKLGRVLARIVLVRREARGPRVIPARAAALASPHFRLLPPLRLGRRRRGMPELAPPLPHHERVTRRRRLHRQAQVLPLVLPLRRGAALDEDQVVGRDPADVELDVEEEELPQDDDDAELQHGDEPGEDRERDRTAVGRDVEGALGAGVEAVEVPRGFDGQKPPEAAL